MEGYWMLSLIIAAGLAFIPANIAKNKGYSFGLWWFYGWMIFIVAIIHVSFIPDKNARQIPIQSALPKNHATPQYSGRSVADEIKKYRELMDQGIISEEEFQAKKEQLLKCI